jgi:zinc protease
MTGLLLDEDTFRSELEVVKNERRMAVDDSVTGTLSEHLFDLAYTSHPDRWPTIGSMAHLEAATVDDLRAFYRAYYAPNNATVVLVGDVDPVETLALLARSYGPLERQPITRRTRPAEPVQREARRLEIERPVVAPQLLVGFHAPPQLDDEFTAIEILNDALCAGDSARLYRRLVTDEQIATDVGGYTSPFSEPGLYELHVTARPHADPERVLDVLREELDALASGLEPRELNKARHDLEMGHYEGLHDAESCAENLGHFETNYGDFSLAFRSEERFARVDPGALGRVAGELLRPDNATVVIAKAPAS